jgi:hypothetical protein
MPPAINAMILRHYAANRAIAAFAVAFETLRV